MSLARSLDTKEFKEVSFFPRYGPIMYAVRIAERTISRYCYPLQNKKLQIINEKTIEGTIGRVKIAFTAL